MNKEQEYVPSFNKKPVFNIKKKTLTKNDFQEIMGYYNNQYVTLSDNIK